MFSVPSDIMARFQIFLDRKPFNEIMIRQYSPKTLKTYSIWLKRFQAFTRSKALESITDEDYKALLTFLAVDRHVAASTQNQAFNALLFFSPCVKKGTQ